MKALIFFSYLGINAIIAALIGSIVFKGESMVSPKTAAIALALMFADSGLPKDLKAIQSGLAFLVFGSFAVNNQITQIAGISFLCISILIKFYGIYCLVRGIKHQESQEEVSAPKMKGKDFYNSQRWRRARFDTLEQQGRVCRSCGEKRVKDENGEPISYHVDHIKPRSKFPHLSLDPKNLRVTCAACNLGRSNRYSNDYLKDREAA